jgi:hypothetical protein
MSDFVETYFSEFGVTDEARRLEVSDALFTSQLASHQFLSSRTRLCITIMSRLVRSDVISTIEARFFFVLFLRVRIQKKKKKKKKKKGGNDALIEQKKRYDN